MKRSLPWFLLLALSAVCFVLWLFIWPEREAKDRNALEFFVIRWGHAITWLFLLLGSALTLLKRRKTKGADRLLIAGGVAYVLFFVTTYILK